MNKTIILLFSLFTISAFAQKKFDSAAYADFHANRWEKVSFNATSTLPFPQALTTEEKLAGLSKCWAEAKYNFANFDLIPNLNWDSLYSAYISRAVAAKTTVDYYHVLQNFYQHLRDGHTAITFPHAYRKMVNGSLPLQVRWIDKKAIVVQNNSSRSEEKIVKQGDELIAVNGEPLQQYIQKNVSPYLHFSTPQDSTERIYRYELFRAKAGEQWQLTFQTTGGKEIKQQFLFQTMESLYQNRPLLEFSVLPGNIGYVQLHSFGSEKIVQQFDSIFPSLSRTSALIIDVRNNGGGNGGNGFEILGYLTDKTFHTGKTMIRRYRPVGRSWGGPEAGSIEEEAWKPYKNKLYSRPVIVLTSGATYSAAEDFTATFKSMKRGVVMGEPTGGSTGQPVFFSLPGGGLGYVCSKRDFFSDGTEFIGVGIQPDVLVRPSAQSVVAGKDNILDAAIHYLEKEK